MRYGKYWISGFLMKKMKNNILENLATSKLLLVVKIPVSSFILFNFSPLGSLAIIFSEPINSDLTIPFIMALAMLPQPINPILLFINIPPVKLNFSLIL